MNYDLCDLLNRKLEQHCGYLDTFPSKTNYKNQEYLDKIFEKMDTELFLETIDKLESESSTFGFWLYRNGKISKQLSDFDSSAKRVIKELANLSYSNNPIVDLLYFSAIIKIHVAINKAILVECCMRPSLDQIMILKDMEKHYLPENGVVIWRIFDRKAKNNVYEGNGLEGLHSFKWSRIK
jgi:hypothetical protein